VSESESPDDSDPLLLLLLDEEEEELSGSAAASPPAPTPCALALAEAPPTSGSGSMSSPWEIKSPQVVDLALGCLCQVSHVAQEAVVNVFLRLLLVRRRNGLHEVHGVPVFEGQERLGSNSSSSPSLRRPRRLRFAAQELHEVRGALQALLFLRGGLRLLLLHGGHG